MPSEMTGLKAARQNARSISLQTCCRPFWITARLMGSSVLMAAFRWRQFTATRRLPLASAAARLPGSRTVVQSSCSMIAGPSTAAGRLSRW